MNIYVAEFDISASYCVHRYAAAGGIFSCFIHELINGAQIALLSILANAQPACVCLLRHSSLLAEGHRKQHKLSIQLYAPQKIWQDIRTYATIKSPFILRPSPILSLLRAVGMIFLRLCVCLKRESQLDFCTEVDSCSFSAQLQSPTVMTTFPHKTHGQDSK